MKIIIIYALAIQSGEAALLGRNRHVLNLNSSSATFKLHIHWQFTPSLCVCFLKCKIGEHQALNGIPKAPRTMLKQRRAQRPVTVRQLS